jgi:hypothetical protein
MSFLAKTDTGVLVNRYVMTFALRQQEYELTHKYFFPHDRFSQDMQLVDMTLPGALVNASFRP